ncbi:MAG: type II secretion system protein [Chlamydiota bacterium]|nr:type II secretion system protein [Chlamydiota bacterium]
MNAQKENAGLSVIEMLASMTIIMILAALLMGSIGASYEKSKQSQCINNQHQIIGAVLLFALDKNRFPSDLAQLPESYMDIGNGNNTKISSLNAIFSPQSAEASAMTSYLDNVSSILKCPKVQGTIFDNPPVYSYGMNALMVDANYHQIRQPSEVMVIADSDTPLFESLSQLPGRHVFGALAGFADGHVEWAKEFNLVLSSAGDESYFHLDGGGVVTDGNYITDVNPLLAQVSYGGWYWNCNKSCYPDYLFDFLDVYLGMEVTDPITGEVTTYDITDPNGPGIDGWWNEVDFSDFSLFQDPGTIPEGAEINFVTTSKWYLPHVEYQGKKKGWQTVWEQTTYKTYNTNDHTGEQVYVLKNGDPVPQFEGFIDPIGQQTSLAEAISQYVVDDGNGNLVVNLSDSQAIYFWEISHNYYDWNGFQDPPSGVDFNDLVFFIDFESPQS